MMVTLHYILKEDGPNGTLIEDTFGGAPITFQFGVGQMLPGFEANLKGKAIGDKYAFLLAPGEAYGDTNFNAIKEIPIANFAGSDGKIDETKIALGESIRMKNQQGQSFQGVIKEITQESVKIDFNHPMAGITLHFSGEIVDIKEDIGLG